MKTQETFPPQRKRFHGGGNLYTAEKTVVETFTPRRKRLHRGVKVSSVVETFSLWYKGFQCDGNLMWKSKTRKATCPSWATVQLRVSAALNCYRVSLIFAVWYVRPSISNTNSHWLHRPDLPFFDSIAQACAPPFQQACLFQICNTCLRGG